MTALPSVGGAPDGVRSTLFSFIPYLDKCWRTATAVVGPFVCALIAQNPIEKWDCLTMIEPTRPY